MEFNLKLLYTLGSQMIQSDALSHRPDYILNNTDNDDVIVLPDNIFVKAIDLGLQEEIQRLVNDDELFAKALELIKSHGLVPIKLKLDDWTMNDGLLFFCGQCYIPPDDTLR